jgi:hypothetical protein
MKVLLRGLVCFALLTSVAAGCSKSTTSSPGSPSSATQGQSDTRKGADNKNKAEPF